MKIDKDIVAERKQKLEQIRQQLKTEFFGLDTIIDKVIASVYAWYVFPELIQRPVTVNLWGMTGTGKTSLVRRLAALLGFSNKFVEIQMDGTSNGSYYRKDSICSLLSDCIHEGEPGILLLDEIQRFRTIASDGSDVKVERFQDVWMLLSDGRFAANSDLFLELEVMLAQQAYDQDNAAAATSEKTEGKTEEPAKPKKRFKLWTYEAKRLKQFLRLSEPIQEIMTWDAQKLNDVITNMRDSRVDWQIDYSKLLIFVSGNLDSAFVGSTSSEDCDTDADFYHHLTSKITSIDIKRALQKQFKPEQISRLGSTHIIYPSMKKDSYYKLIRASCAKYLAEMHKATNITFQINNAAYDIIYNNSVYPTQGTRPVFSAIHKIFSTGLVNIACWCLENNVHTVDLAIDEKNQKMIAVDKFDDNKFETEIELELSERKARISPDVKTLVAVHESGHAVIYALLTKSAPIETKINAISFANGYVLPNEDINANRVTTKTLLLNKIAMLLGGMAAEEIVFGAQNRSSGSRSDIFEATSYASQYVRILAYNGKLSYTNQPSASGLTQWNVDLDSSNGPIEDILSEQYEIAKELIERNATFHKKLVDTLLADGVIDQQRFIELSRDFVQPPLTKQAYIPAYHDQYRQYVASFE